MTFTLTSLVLNLAAWLAGIATCHLMFHKSRGDKMDRPKRRRNWWPLILSVILVLIGLQQLQFQAAGKAAADRTREQAACYSAWGQEMSLWATGVVDTIGTRTDATAKLDKAKVRKDDALDDIIAVVIGARTVPPTATEKDFDEALTEFAAAKKNLIRAQAQTDQTRQANPYPTAPILDCSGG